MEKRPPGPGYDPGSIILSAQAQRKLKIISSASDGYMRYEDAAKELGISTRQVQRLVTAYREEGAQGLLHGNLGSTPHNATKKEIADEVEELYKSTYGDFGPQLFSEVLEDLHDIVMSRETIRRLLSKKGLRSPAIKKAPHRRRRERKACFGEMVQMDTSFHHWFGEDRPKAYLLCIIDDATSIAFAKFYDADSTLTNMDCLKNWFELHGLPLAAYTDRASHFRVNTPPKSDERSGDHDRAISEADMKKFKTQIQRALAELGVRMIFAGSPEAKGRVERSFGTAQDRLVKLMRVHGVTDIESGNAFLKTKYVPHWNRNRTV
ncbi:MAG: ISNCY family transposase, partial [Deltaproteobacteria bacterium]|nr:ISNCY family transposase [Deltaproteobacteria bacterium]